MNSCDSSYFTVEDGYHLPSVVFLFGFAGAGKNFCAEVLARRFRYEIYDLDHHITPAMRTAIADGQSFTDEMRDEFFAVVRSEIAELLQRYPRLILHQGAYKERHRIAIRSAYPPIEFVWVTAPQEMIVQRLMQRGTPVSAEYAAAIAKNFEPPEPLAKVLVNDTSCEQELAMRFVSLFKKT